MRIAVFLSLVLGLAACGGGEGGGEDDPRRFERSKEEWVELCGPLPPIIEEAEGQMYRSDGSIICPGDPILMQPHCLAYYGGAGFADIEKESDCHDGWPILCVTLDSNDLPWAKWECVSPSEAKRRSL